MTTEAAPLHERLQALAIRIANAVANGEVTLTESALRDIAYTLSDASREAQRDHLSDGVLTAAQQRRIARLFESGHVRELLVVSYAPFDLPTGWIMVQIKYTEGNPITGGISPDGEMNT